jgi:hypothetical protein
MKTSLLLPAVVSLLAFSFSSPAEDQSGVSRMPVVISGGHDTDPVDRGRPVSLIAGALGVPPEAFRQAFSHMHPGDPDHNSGPGAEAQKNKQALLSDLKPYDVTDDRLGSVTGYYRYVRGRGELWPVKAATAVALVKNGEVIAYEVTEGGSGYSTPPAITVPGVKSAPARVTLSMSKTFEKNGAIGAITITPAN